MSSLGINDALSACKQLIKYNDFLIITTIFFLHAVYYTVRSVNTDLGGRRYGKNHD